MQQIQLQQYGCPATLLPTQADMANFFIQLANIPSQLLAYAAAIGGEAAQVLIDTAKEIIDILKNVAEIIDEICADITKPIFNDLRIPEIEWEMRIKSMIQSFHSYIMRKLLELIDAVLPVNFTVTILGIAIDVLEFFANPKESVKNIIAQIKEEIDKFFDMIPDLDKFFAGIEKGVQSFELKARAVLDYIMRKINEGLLGILYDILGELIEAFDEIWDALGLPNLIALFTMDVDAIVQEFIDAADGVISDAVDALLDFSIAGYSVLEMIGGEIKEAIQSPEKKLKRIVDALRDFKINWAKKLILGWMEEVMEFFEAIGLNLLEWVVFTFCDFLNLFGFPFDLKIDNSLVSVNPSAAPSPA